MSHRVSCPHCGAEYRLPDKVVQRRFRCKKPDCQQVILIPDNADSADVEDKTDADFMSALNDMAKESAQLEPTSQPSMRSITKKGQQKKRSPTDHAPEQLAAKDAVSILLPSRLRSLLRYGFGMTGGAFIGHGVLTIVGCSVSDALGHAGINRMGEGHSPVVNILIGFAISSFGVLGSIIESQLLLSVDARGKLRASKKRNFLFWPMGEKALKISAYTNISTAHQEVMLTGSRARSIVIYRGHDEDEMHKLVQRVQKITGFEVIKRKLFGRS